MAEHDAEETFVVFCGHRRLGAGALAQASELAIAAATCGEPHIVILSELSGKPHDPIQREAAKPARGRPKLGVKSKEVTLLPRHWEWLDGQPGGASATLRRLVEAARKASQDGDQARAAREALHRAMTTLAGDQAGYEEALRLLYRGDEGAFNQIVSAWPSDVSEYLRSLAARGAFS